MRVQEHAREPEKLQILVEVFVPVALVTGHGVTGVRRVDANLVSAPRVDRDLEQRGDFSEPIDEPERAARILAGLVDLDARLSTDAARHEWRVYLGRAFGPGALDQRQVALVDASFAQQLVQHAQGASSFREQQAARRIAVETVRELEVLRFGP